VAGVLFAFMLLHQADQLLIGPLTTPIMQTFGLDEAQMGAVFTGALLAAGVLFPLWGYLYDRFARARLLAAAAFLWGSTTWLSALAPSYPVFLATRAATGVDDASYPGLYSLMADYFGPALRGRVYGLLQIAMPLGYLLGTVLALGLREVLGWRGVFYVTGTLGLAVAGLIFVAVREPARGGSEPELAALEQLRIYRFDRRLAWDSLRQPGLLGLFAQGFFGSFPWNVITYWFFRYLEVERGYSDEAVLATMVAAVLVLAAGYFVGGALGDHAFRRTPRGRLWVCLAGTLLGAGLLTLTLAVPVEQQLVFGGLLAATALFVPFASPNVLATISDITLPEARSTVIAIQHFVEVAGAATAPLLAGLIAVRTSLHVAILAICLVAWLVCALFQLLTAWHVPPAVARLRRQLRERARRELASPGVGAGP
jgi:MFS family permease